MGGKGQRRREKNYKAAHGGYSRLPPPPKPNEIDTLPSKLRKLIDFTTLPPTKGALISTTTTDNKHNNKNKGDPKNPAQKKLNPKDGSSAKGYISKDEPNNGGLIKDNKRKDRNEKSTQEDARDKKRAKKRKREQVKDLRFGTTEEHVTTSTKKRDRKKKYLEAKKKKQNKTQTKEDLLLNFPGPEDIKFGDIVDAPPKFTIPKGVKKIQTASHERLRLQAIEAYRNRKGGGSRLGVSIPGIVQDQSE